VAGGATVRRVTTVTVQASGPPGFLQLTAHPVRWRLLGELARSDRTVQELAGLVQEAQNLVSYHLAKLREGGLVSARRSTADRRDSYYAVDLTRLGEQASDATAALHPGLRLQRAPDPALPAEPVQVLFLCTGNSARSQVAEALLRHRSGGAVTARSAGSHPKVVHPDAIRVLRERYELDASEATSKHLDLFASERFDWVISLCDKVREVCPELPGHPETAHWSIPDPSLEPDARRRRRAFRALADELDLRIGFLLAAIADRRNVPSPPRRIT
jgi:protein-tyrosine-phosphatase